MTESEGLDWGYDSYLTQVPEGLREQIKPAFDGYSENLKSKITEQYGALDPYKEFADNGWQPEHINVGLQLLQMANDNPAQIVQGILQEHPNLASQIPGLTQTPTTQTPTGNTNTGTDFDLPPQLQERLDQQEQIIQLLYKGFQQNQEQQQTAAQQAQEQVELQQFQRQLDQVAPADKYPRQFILSYVAQGQTPEQAVKSYGDWRTSELQRANGLNAPLVAPTGGGVPSEPIDTSKLTGPQREALMVQYLQRANQAG